MANQEHLDILTEGVEVWNQWRKEHPDRQPELSDADLEATDLSNANLRRADLRRANLHSAILTDVNFSRANLSRAQLSLADIERSELLKSNLRAAKLFGADLSYAHLRGANLTGARLGAAVLRHTNLHSANLNNADLNNAIFRFADLSDANLKGATLDFADLNTANLSRTNLGGTSLMWTNFLYTDLNETNLLGATLMGTVFGDVNLSTVKGLETIIHTGPSTIGIDTLMRSKGDIPVLFLKGAGISDKMIEYARSLVGQAIEYYTCFLSYSSHDQNIAERLYADLQNKGVRCWFAPEDLKIGDHYHQRIDESIGLYNKLVLILSEHAVQSAWVEREVVTAREKEDHLGHEVLFPIRLDDAVLQTTKAWAADVRRRWHIGDFTQWKHHDAYQQALERLLRDLKSEAQQ